MASVVSKVRDLDEITLFLGVGFLSTILYALWNAVYNLCFSPLSKYPGPKLAAICELPHLYWSLKGMQHVKLKELHDTYGDVVRTGPRRVIYRSAQGWKDIYGHRKAGAGSFLKDPQFYTIGPYGPNILNSNEADHSRERRLLAHAFSEKALRDQEDLIQTYVDLLVGRLDDEISASRETTEMTKWFNFATFDIIGDLLFADPFNCLKERDYHPWVKKVFIGVKGGVFMMPALIYPSLKLIWSVLMPKQIAKERAEFFQFSKDKMQSRLSSKTIRPDFMTHVLRHNDERGMTIPEMEANAALLIIAGSETTASLLSGFSFFITSNPEVYQKVVNEVRGAFKSYDDINFKNTSTLSYLSATLEESLRMYPPVPALIPRVVPKGGAIIDGEFVPEGVSVSGAHLSTYRAESHFTEANSFIPERWLPDGDEKFATDRRDIVHAFSLGPRNCLGKNLAYAEMRVIAAKVLWSFDLTLDKTCIDWDKQQAYNIWEKSPLLMKLSRVKH